MEKIAVLFLSLILASGCAVKPANKSAIGRAHGALQPATTPQTQGVTTPQNPVEDRAALADNPRLLLHKASPPAPDRVFKKWSPIWWWGNIDSTKPPAWYRPQDPGRKWKWYSRNPLHNFMFYVIGIADKDFTRVGRYAKEVFSPEASGWNWAVIQYQWLRLPFISYHCKYFKFYLGWRERGNFGAKLNFLVTSKKQDQKN